VNWGLVYVTRTRRLRLRDGGQGDAISGPARVSTGGSSALVANLELRVPSPVFSSRMHLTFFVDVGQVWDEAQGLYFSLGDLRVTPGVGLRFATPLGPVRIEAGYNGYAREVGPLYFETDSSIVRIRDGYSTPRPTSFFRRLTLQFAVGPTF
jgi:outer membrane protein insertion porin family